MTGLSSTAKAILLVVCATLFFVSLDVTAKYLSGYLPVPQVVWVRYASHVLWMLVFIWPRLGSRLFRTRRLRFQIGRGLLLLITTVLSIAGLHYLPLAEVTAMGFVAPLLVVVLSALILREKIGPRRWGAVIVGFVGVLIVVRPGGGVASWPVVFPLAMAFSYALYQIVARILATTENASMTLFYTGLTGMVGASVFLPFVWVTPTDPFIIALMLLTGFLGGAGHLLLTLAFGLAPPSLLQPFLFSQLILSTGAGWVFFGTVPDAISLGGIGVIGAAGLYVWYRETYGRRKPAG